ncbi:M15 family metallopeptidase [Paenibacillus sp. FSL R7-0204]|uniref:M15 family metallopeptidase n=1 Tax=Paenibacillus sp. FSL R7-0204 TaxID=2921675 RepID=UPI0030FC0D6F
MLLVAYSISMICAVMLFIALSMYFHKRFKRQTVSLFMLGVFFFLSAYTFKMAVAFWIRFTSASGGAALYATLKSTAWAVAQIGTTLGLVVLTYLMYTKGQDIFMSLPRKGKNAMLTLDQVKLKSMPRMSGLHPVLEAGTVALIERCYARGVPIIVTQGLRTIAEQDALYAQGRTRPGRIVTNARGGHSYHNYGLAIDFALLLPNGSSVSWDMTRDGDQDGVADWQEVIQEAKALGFESGGDWTSFKDYPHLQMTFGLRLADLLAGRQPTGVQMDAAYARIDKLQGEAEQPMTAQEKKDFEAMQLLIKAQAEAALNLSNRVTGLEKAAKLPEIPKWALPACEAAKAAGLLDTTANGSYDFYRMVTILNRAGVFKKGAK